MRLTWLLVIGFVSVELTGCGGGGGGTQPPPSTSTPIFTSTPGTQAEEAFVYTYQAAATDPSGGAVTFSLSTAPNGAALSGSTLTWTPTAPQSRTANSFTLTATSASGGTARQSWSVTPNGTITVNWINTYWSPSGPTPVPANASLAFNVQAVVMAAPATAVAANNPTFNRLRLSGSSCIR